MRIFKRETDMADNGKPQRQQAQRSRLQLQNQYLTTAINALTSWMDVNSKLNFDMQHVVDALSHTVREQTAALEEAGGEADRESVEEQIKDFLPRVLQREPQQ